MNEHPLVTEYRNFSPNSAAFSARAAQVFPGGDTRASAHYKPFPLAIERATGSRLYDVDGHELIDFMNNFTSLIHGHAHPEVVAAIQHQAPLGSAYAACNDAQVELAELIKHEFHRLSNCVSPVPAQKPRSWLFDAPGRQLDGKNYEDGRRLPRQLRAGRSEFGSASTHAGELHAPASTPVDPSFPASVLEDTVICPYNEPQLARQLIKTTMIWLPSSLNPCWGPWAWFRQQQNFYSACAP